MIPDFSQGQTGDADISHYGSFHRPGIYRNAAGAGGHLAQQSVLDAAAKHMDGLIFFSGDGRKSLKGIFITHGDALINASHDLAAGLRHGLPCAFAVLLDPAGKIAGSLKLGRVGINIALERPGFQGLVFQNVEANLAALPHPLPTGFLDQPKTHNVL